MLYKCLIPTCRISETERLQLCYAKALFLSMAKIAVTAGGTPIAVLILMPNMLDYIQNKNTTRFVMMEEASLVHEEATGKSKMA